MTCEFGINGNIFKVVMDDMGITLRGAELSFKENHYTHYGKDFKPGDSYMTKEEFDKAKNDFLQSIRNLSSIESLKQVLRLWPKDEEGMLDRRNEEYLCKCDICRIKNNAWTYEAVRAIASDNRTILIEGYEKTDTPDRI